jgi:hypothetical protein
MLMCSSCVVICCIGVLKSCQKVFSCLTTSVLSVHASRQVIMKYQRRTMKAAMYDGRLLVTLASAVDQLVDKCE